MSKEWLWWLGEFGLAAVVAVVAGIVTKDVPISILYGLFVGTVFFTTREHIRVVSKHERQIVDMENKLLGVSQLNYLENYPSFFQKIVTREKKDLQDLAEDIAKGEINLTAHTLSEYIEDFSRLPKRGDKVFAVSDGAGWGLRHWDRVRENNKKLWEEKKVRVTRIFIWSNKPTPEEVKLLNKEIEEQKKAEIIVRNIYARELPPRCDLTHNFNLIVGKYLGMAWFGELGPTGLKQREAGIKVSINPKTLAEYKEIIDQILEESTEELKKVSEEYK